MAKLLSGRLPKLNVGISSSLSALNVTGGVNIVGITTVTSISSGSTTGQSGQYLQSTGIGITWASFPTLRDVSTFVATSGQTSFTVSYNVGFVDVYINGVRLTESEYTASNGTSIVLNEACFGEETVDIISYNTTSNGSSGNSNIEYSSTAGIATYSTTAGIATNATYSTSAGIATYASTAGIATYATTAGIATYSTTAGIATVAQGLTGTPNISVGTVTATSYNGSGSNLTGITTSSTGSWTVTSGSNTYSFTVPANRNYVMWMRGNIPNGICVWNATVSITNTNVPVLGNQYAWYYDVGNQLVLTSIPNQIIGTSGSIITTSPAVSNTNTFSFGITNNSGTNQTVYYGYSSIQ